MADRDEQARLRILAAYERAKRENPSMTQADFMLAGAPGSQQSGLAGRFHNRESAARYFRKIRSGERTGGAMYREGEVKQGMFQLRAKFGDKHVSQNILVANAPSSFDTYAVEQEIKRNRREDVEKIVAYFRARYGKEDVTMDMASIRVRRVEHQRRMPTMRLGITR